jgi:sugar O-acyltransferase (sialic acid O-acetyltransferase NeuD family)
MQRDVILFGAGDHGRGTLEILRARAASGLEAPRVLGFVDDDPARQGGQCGDLPVFGPLSWLLERAGEPWDVILALASPNAKRAVAAKCDAAGFSYATAIHPSVILGTGSTVAPGTILGAGVVVVFDSTIGRYITINLNSTLGHDCVIGDYCTIAPGVNITGKVQIGEGAQVQTNAAIVPGVKVGAWARVGPGSVVLQDVGEGDFVFGNPARKMPEMKGKA